MRSPRSPNTRLTNQRTRGRRVLATLGALVSAIGMVPLASAHGGGTHVYVGGTHVTQAYAPIPLVKNDADLDVTDRTRVSSPSRSS
jgi:hypothetical protein